MHTLLRALLGACTVALTVATAAAQTADCPNRGDLDPIYCDANRDLLADTPTDPAKLKNPSTLVFTYTPVEDPAKYENAFKPFTDHLAQCTSKRVVFFQVQNNAAQIEALRSGRLHVGGFSTGPTVFAVNKAGAIPFAVKGNDKGYQGYNLITIVKTGSPFQKLADLKGRKVAHTSPSSNSGHLAPLALLPAQGLAPGKDYEIRFSGKHDQSVLGVNSGDYDAAHVASDVFDRMADRGQIKEADFRVLYRSQVFPTSSFAYAHDLQPALAQQIVKCFNDFRFPDAMKKDFDGVDRFVPISYQKDWAVVREVDKVAAEQQKK
jgi:phosphonate transport system substrate-binding protein